MSKPELIQTKPFEQIRAEFAIYHLKDAESELLRASNFSNKENKTETDCIIGLLQRRIYLAEKAYKEMYGRPA